MKSLVIIPTYNEKDNIEKLIKEIFCLNLPPDLPAPVGQAGADSDVLLRSNLDLLIIDDNSPDGTGDIVEKLKVSAIGGSASGGKNQKLEIIHREKKLGLGTAYIRGFKFALQHNYDYIITMDADLSHDPKYIPKFIERLKDYYLVVGSRYISGGDIVGWPLHRKILSCFGNLYAKIVTGLPIRDCTSGFVGYDTGALKNINLDEIRSEGYGFLIELKYRIFKKNYKISELPIIFIDRIKGKSKISRKIILEALLLVFKLRFFPK